MSQPLITQICDEGWIHQRHAQLNTRITSILILVEINCIVGLLVSGLIS